MGLFQTATRKAHTQRTPFLCALYCLFSRRLPFLSGPPASSDKMSSASGKSPPSSFPLLMKVGGGGGPGKAPSRQQCVTKRYPLDYAAPPLHANVKKRPSQFSHFVPRCDVCLCHRRGNDRVPSRQADLLVRGVKASLCKSPSKPKYIFPCPPKNQKQRQILSFYKQRMEIHLGDNH